MTESEKTRENFQNTIFKFSFCLSVMVNMLYWSLNFLAPSMLGDIQTPVILDIFLHGKNLLVLLFVDYLLDHSCDKGNHSLGKSSLLKLSLFYFVLLYSVYYSLSIDVYLMIGKITVPQFSMVGVAGYYFFYFGHLLYEKVIVLK